MGFAISTKPLELAQGSYVMGEISVTRSIFCWEDPSSIQNPSDPASWLVAQQDNRFANLREIWERRRLFQAGRQGRLNRASLVAHSASRPPQRARVQLAGRVFESAALATPGMLREPSASAGGPTARDLGPATGLLTQGAPGAHLHVPRKGEPNRPRGLAVIAPNVRACSVVARHQISLNVRRWLGICAFQSP